jgi:hypothetical protein
VRARSPARPDHRRGPTLCTEDRAALYTVWWLAVAAGEPVHDKNGARVIDAGVRIVQPHRPLLPRTLDALCAVQHRHGPGAEHVHATLELRA